MRGGYIARIFERGKGRFIRQFFTAKRGRNGFTVIEVLIVLAVTGFLFLGAALLIAGRRQQTEFNQAIRQVQSQIQQVINEVGIGYYPKTGNFRCTVSGTNAPTISPGVSEQGANTGCIFIGKAIQFRVAGTSPEQFKVYTLVGRRLSWVNPGADSSSPSQAKPVAIAPSSADPNIPDNSENYQLQSGLTTVSMEWDAGAGGTPVAVVGFMQSLATGSVIQSGAQTVHVIPVSGTVLNATPQETVTQINTTFSTSAMDPSKGVRICFASGGTNQSGLITIGGGQRQLSVTLDIKSNKTCS